MDSKMDVDLVPSDKKCKTCRINVLPYYSSFKNCPDCRAKNRMKEARRNEKLHEQNKLLATHKMMLMESVSKHDAHRIMEGHTSTFDATGSSAGGSIDAPVKLLHEMNGRERQYAIKEMKALLNKRIQGSGGVVKTPLPLREPEDGATEYQAASSLYEKLKNRSSRYSAAGKPLTFHGCHSIVRVSSINHRDRVELVVKDLRKISRISFGKKPAIMERTSDDSLFRMRFECSCMLAATDNQCNGKVSVTAELDGSHPLVLVGQKIIVHIHHS